MPIGTNPFASGDDWITAGRPMLPGSRRPVMPPSGGAAGSWRNPRLQFTEQDTTSGGRSQMDSMAMQAFGRTTDLPAGHPVTTALENMGYFNLNPGAFPDRQSREGISSSLLQAMSGMFGAAGGGAEGGPAGAGGVGAGPQKLPERTDMSSMMAALGDKPPPLPPPPELPGRVASPGNLAALQAPSFTPGMGPPPVRSQATRGQIPRFGVSRHKM